jgi:hypothetical protein
MRRTAARSRRRAASRLSPLGQYRVSLFGRGREKHHSGRALSHSHPIVNWTRGDRASPHQTISTGTPTASTRRCYTTSRPSAAPRELSSWRTHNRSGGCRSAFPPPGCRSAFPPPEGERPARIRSGRRRTDDAASERPTSQIDGEGNTRRDRQSSGQSQWLNRPLASVSPSSGRKTDRALLARESESHALRVPAARRAARGRREEAPYRRPAYEHLAKCSPCYRDFRRIQQSGRQSTRFVTSRAAWVAAAAAVVLLAAGAVWMLRPVQNSAVRWRRRTCSY